MAGKVGGGLQLDGMADYVALPLGSLIRWLTNATFSTWVNFSNEGGAWQRIFDFGSNTTYYMFPTPRTGTAGPMRFGITAEGGGASEQLATAPSTLPSGWHHVAVTINADADTIGLYLDGVVVAENTAATLTPFDLGTTTLNWLGRSQYPDDAYFDGALDDFRIYSRALSPVDVEELFKTGQPDIETGLVAYYPCDEGDGTVVHNAVEGTTGGDGQINGLDYEWVQGRVGDSAILFKGRNGTVVDCGTYDPSEGTGELAVAAWMKWQGLNGQYQGVVAKRNDWTAEDTCWQLELNIDTGNIAFTRYDSYPDFGINIPPVGQWQHVAVTHDGTTSTMYIDGVAVGTNTDFSFGPKTDAHVVFGAVDVIGNCSFNGVIDDVRIYNRALRAVDVKELFRSRPFRISQVLVETTGGFQLTWTSIPGVWYVVWSRTDLASGDWVQEQTVPSAGDITSWTDPSPGGSRKFYRVKQY